MTQVSGLYLHVPFCKHLCNYCDFYKQKLTAEKTQFEDFHQFLISSWDRHEFLMREQKMDWAPLTSVYLGGGTPSLWGALGAEFFRDFYLSKLQLDQAEFTMEIDPGTWTPEMIEAWKKIGLNRISIGTQTLDGNFLKVMDRIHSLEETHSLLRYCSENNWNFSLDFLLGIPYSQEKNRDIIHELTELLSYSPTHISLYILNARSKYPLVESLPDDEYIREEFLKVSEFLRSRGFHHYEVSNFALPGFESRHNLKYWRGEAVAAFGPTGTGFFPQGKKALRYNWKVMSPDFQPEDLGENELLLEFVYLSLRTSEGWKPTHLTRGLEQVFQSWEAKNYGQFTAGKMVLNATGFVMLDSLMDDLFREGLA